MTLLLGSDHGIAANFEKNSILGQTVFDSGHGIEDGLIEYFEIHNILDIIKTLR